MFSMQTSSFPIILYFPNGRMIFQKYLMSIILENSFFDKFYSFEEVKYLNC